MPLSARPNYEQLEGLFSTSPLCDERQFFKSHWQEYEIAPENQDAFDWVLQTHQDAQEAYQRGDLNAAIRLNEEALEIFPEFAEAYIHLATIYQRAEAWDKCLETVERAYQNVEDDVPWLHYYRGRSLYQRQNLDAALNEFLQEVVVSGASEGVLRWILQIFEDHLDAKRTTNWRKDRNALECALFCGFRILKIRSDVRLADRLCALWDELERSGGWNEQQLAKLTGMSRHDFNDFYRSFANRRTAP